MTRRWGEDSRRAALVGLVLSATLSGCGGGDSGGDSGSAAPTPTATSTPASYDGDWAGTLSTGGVIEFTVSAGTITAARVTSGDEVFGPGCGVLNGSNELPETDIAIEDDAFSWGGSGEGYPVEGRFDSESTASGTAEFTAPEVAGKPAPGCTSVTATWEATNASAPEAATPTEQESSDVATEAGPGVSSASAACIRGLGYEVAEADADDLPITDADGEGLPVVDGASGVGIRGSTGVAVFYVYDTNQQATDAYLDSTGNPDIQLLEARVDAIAIDNVVVLSNAGFISDDRFYLADCFD